jgi:hypothetical protein
MNDKRDEQIFELPGPQQGNPDPLADYKAYFAYWELKELTRRREQAKRWSSLSVYERAREESERKQY